MPCRRKFLKAIGGTVGGVLWLSADSRGAEPSGSAPTAAATPTAEPPDLGSLVEKHFHNEGRSCAESMLYSGLEYLEEPRELERLATPFGGGMHMGDHCGFFCAGLMLIGLGCAGLKDGRKVSAEIQKTYTEFWKKNWPLTCRDIKTAQKEAKIQGGCTAIGKAAGAELGKLLKPLVGDPSRIRFATKPRA